MRRRLMKAVLELPPIYRVPVVLRDIQGLTTEEASAVLNVKDQTLKSRLHRGRLILRQRLADFASGPVTAPARFRRDLSGRERFLPDGEPPCCDGVAHSRLRAWPERDIGGHFLTVPQTPSPSPRRRASCSAAGT